MTNTLSSPELWAQAQFGFVELGDRRRNRRLVQIAENLAANPGGTLPQAFSTWAELKAAYRLFNQEDVTFRKILTPHIKRTRAACQEPGEYLLIEDTSILDYSNHTATGQQCLKPKPAPKGESRRERLSRDRKSQRWTAELNFVERPPERSQWIFIADCEADFYEPMQSCLHREIDFIIRCFQDRRLADEDGTHLREALNKAPSKGQLTVEVGARPDQPARVATCEVRSIQVDLDGPWRPDGWQAPLQGLTAIEIREINPPAEVKKPLHWILLTSLSCRSWTEIRRVIGRYSARWWIEEYHKALKSGTKVEDSQLERASRLEALIAILAVVAVRLLSTKMLARSQPDGRTAYESFGPEVVAVLKKKFGVPKGGWTNANLLIAVARFGGFLARKSDGLPGWQTIWRGWHRIMWIVQGLEI